MVLAEFVNVHEAQRTKVKAVGEVRHGYATGHIWECINTEGCDKAARERLISGKVSGRVRGKIENGLQRGRFTEYINTN